MSNQYSVSGRKLIPSRFRLVIHYYTYEYLPICTCCSPPPSSSQGIHAFVVRINFHLTVGLGRVEPAEFRKSGQGRARTRREETGECGERFYQRQRRHRHWHRHRYHVAVGTYQFPSVNQSERGCARFPPFFASSIRPAPLRRAVAVDSRAEFFCARSSLVQSEPVAGLAGARTRKGRSSTYDQAYRSLSCSSPCPSYYITTTLSICICIYLYLRVNNLNAYFEGEGKKNQQKTNTSIRYIGVTFASEERYILCIQVGTRRQASNFRVVVAYYVVVGVRRPRVDSKNS